MESWLEKAKKVERILSRVPAIDKSTRIDKSEFSQRIQKVVEALYKAEIDIGVVYSDEHYCGDVPYLGGCNNISIEPVAGLIGRNGFHVLSGLEGGYVVEQLAFRAGVQVHKVEMLKLADEEYPIDAENIDDIMIEVCGRKPDRVGLLTPKSVLPVSIYEYLVNYMGDSSLIVDAQELYQKIKYEKSDTEMVLIEQASQIADVMLEGMLAVLEPGMLETEVSSWGYLIGQQLGVEEFGFDIMVTANEANRTLIGKSLNRVINQGDYVQLGVAPKRDGLTACERATVICTKDKNMISKNQAFWIDFVEKAYLVGYESFKYVAENNLPAKMQEQALVDYFASRQEEVNSRFGINIDLTKQKPYTGTHNSGYTECQEFYGAITLNSDAPLGNQIVTMLDVAIKGIGNHWNEIVIPGVDYVLVEKTLGKFGSTVRTLNNLPINLQDYVGNVIE